MAQVCPKIAQIRVFTKYAFHFNPKRNHQFWLLFKENMSPRHVIKYRQIWSHWLLTTATTTATTTTLIRDHQNLGLYERKLLSAAAKHIGEWNFLFTTKRREGERRVQKYLNFFWGGGSRHEHFWVTEIQGTYLIRSVTGKLYCSFNIWPFTSIKNGPMSYY